MDIYKIKHFADYHEIQSEKYSKYESLELGCFPVEEYGCCRYFALFFIGKRPSAKKVIASVLKRVALGDFYCKTGEVEVYDKIAIIQEIKKVMK